MLQSNLKTATCTSRQQSHLTASCSPRSACFTPVPRRMIGTRAQHSEQASTIGDAIVVDRRSLMMGAFSLALVSSSSLPQPAHAVFTPPPQGFRAQVDILDGYRFFYPEGWIGVTSSGNDCFLRNPRNIDECVFVDFSSPSSSRYNAVTDLGTPQDTANKILDQFLTKEFMSTRLGIKREGSVLSASSREGPEGRTYYDVAIRMTSYASRNPYVATQGEVLKEYGKEWDRVLITTLAVANKRLYELRLQTSADTFEASRPVLDTIINSFVVKEVEL